MKKVKVKGRYIIERGRYTIERGRYIIERGRYIIERGRYKIERGRYGIEKGRVCIWTIELRSEPGGGAIDGDEDNRSDELGRLRPIDTIFFLRAVSFVLSDKDKAGKMVIAGLNLGRVMKISPKK